MRRSRAKRKKGIGLANAVDVQEWMDFNSETMICCPNQPGNLRIMPASCAKRHRIANEPRWTGNGAEAFPLFVFKVNLVPCRKCQIGALNAARIKGKAA